MFCSILWVMMALRGFLTLPLRGCPSPDIGRGDDWVGSKSVDRLMSRARILSLLRVCKVTLLVA